MTQTTAQPAKRTRRAPTFKSRESELRFRVRAASIDAGMSEDAYRDLLESVSPYRYARLCSEAQLEAALVVLESRKPTAPDYSDDELDRIINASSLEELWA